jgi:hypothetical protein
MDSGYITTMSPVTAIASLAWDYNDVGTYVESDDHNLFCPMGSFTGYTKTEQVLGVGYSITQYFRTSITTDQPPKCKYTRQCQGPYCSAPETERTAQGKSQPVDNINDCWGFIEVRKKWYKGVGYTNCDYPEDAYLTDGTTCGASGCCAKQ